jgi:methylmalonyl-CoA/ethylmalonyl-CoA epimerase
MFKRLLGFNVAVKKENLEETIQRWASIFKVEPNYRKPTDFAVPGILGARLEIGGSHIYVLAGETEKVAVAQFVEKGGEGLFLVSFEVDDVEEVMKEASEKGVKFVSDKPLTFPGGKANFAHPKSMNGIQIEFIQLEE